jgi:hypothetical protein
MISASDFNFTEAKNIINEIGIDSISFDVAKYTYLLQLCES